MPQFPLDVYLCRECWHSQLGVVVNPRLMFDQYLYVSGTTTTFRRHCRDLAADALARLGRPHPRVLDIACNDGTLLEAFRSGGAAVQGVDPAQNLRAVTERKGLAVHVDYWGSGAAASVGGPYDLITGTNVFAHVDTAEEFLLTCRQVLSPGGLVLLEFPYCRTMVLHNEFDTIYHEHLSYFLVHSFCRLVANTGFRVQDVLQTPIHGGSVRFFLQEGTNPLPERVAELIRRERDDGLLAEATYLRFAADVTGNQRRLVQLVGEVRQGGGKVIGYGASAKGNTMLNYCELDLDYIVDDNDLKWGYQTPGRNITIRPPADMRAEADPLHLVLTAWNFQDEIRKKIRAIRGGAAADRIILYVPAVEVRGL